jgi:hypothetical protein
MRRHAVPARMCSGSQKSRKRPDRTYPARPALTLLSEFLVFRAEIVIDTFPTIQKHYHSTVALSTIYTH